MCVSIMRRCCAVASAMVVTAWSILFMVFSCNFCFFRSSFAFLCFFFFFLFFDNPSPSRSSSSSEELLSESDSEDESSLVSDIVCPIRFFCFRFSDLIFFCSFFVFLCIRIIFPSSWVFVICSSAEYIIMSFSVRTSLGYFPLPVLPLFCHCFQRFPPLLPW